MQSCEGLHAVEERLLDAAGQRRQKALATAGETPTLRTRCYVDTGPLVERVYAKHAGVGWIGKNTCILNQKLGPGFFSG